MSPTSAHTAREGRFRHRGAELTYDDSGEGPLAVHAHGGFVSRQVETAMGLVDWEPLLAAGRRLVRYDTRGHGRSTGAAVDTDYTYPSLADDLLALLDHLHAREPVDAMGASMGCGTVLHAATRAPDRFRRLVLLVPPTAWDTRPAHARSNRESAAMIERDGVDAWLAATRAGPRPDVIADVPEFPPTPAEQVLPSVLRGLALSDLPDRGTIAALEHPALVLAWADDPGHPLSTAEALTELLPHAELHVSTTGPGLRTWGERIAAYLTRPTSRGARSGGDGRSCPR